MKEVRLTLIGTQVAFKTAKMIYVLHPMFVIAGGVIYTIRKLQIQLALVEILLPRWRSLSGRISDGYTHTVAWKPMVKAPSKMNSMAAAPMPAAVAIEVLFWTW